MSAVYSIDAAETTFLNSHIIPAISTVPKFRDTLAILINKFNATKTKNARGSHSTRYTIHFQQIRANEIFVSVHAWYMHNANTPMINKRHHRFKKREEGEKNLQPCYLSI